MTTKQLPIYELPPFHLIKLIQPAFQAPSSLTAGASQNVLGVGSPEALNLSAAALSPPPPTGPTSPLNIGTSATINVDNATSTTTLSGRLSQLVGKNVPSSSSPSSSSRPMSPGVAGAAGGFSSSSPSGMTSPELRANRLAPAHGFDSPPSFAFGSNQPVVGGGGSSTARPTSSGRGAQTIRSVEAGAESIWIAGSEGSVAVWKLDADRANAKGKGRAVDAENDSEMLEEAAYLLDQYNVVPGRRPIEKLAVLPTVGKAVILSEGILSLHSLPTFAALPAFAPIRGVSTFAVDLSDPHADVVHVCVIRRKSMQLLSISLGTVDLIKELPLRTTAILAVLRGRYLCIADAVNYSLVDLSSATLIPLLPISQDPPDSPPSEMHDLTSSSMPAAPSRPKSHQRPSILPIENNEFLIASHTGFSTLGLFIKENGEPTRGTLEWPSNPKSLAVEYPYIVALLHNNTMEIHTIHTQELVQVLQLSSLSLRSLDMAEDPSKHLSPSPAGGKVEKIQPRYLASTTAGFPSRMAGAISGDPSFAPLLVPQIGHNSLEKIEVRLSSRSASNGNRQEATKPMQDEPPSTPKKRSILSATRPSQGRQSQYSAPIASKTLLVGRDSIFALCTNTLVVQAEALVIKNRIEDALNLLDAVGPPDTPEKLNEFCYIKQKAAWQLVSETRFKEAGKLLIDARMDPRLIIRLFPDVAGKLFGKLSEDTVSIYRGLRDVLGEDILNTLSIDAIIETNLVRNYSPHLQPSSPSMSNLHGRLEKDARKMLRDFLMAWRNERRTGDLAKLGFSSLTKNLVQDLDKLVDTSLAKLYLDDIQGTRMLFDMLEREAHDCDVDDLAPLLEKHSLHWYLSQLLLLEHRIADTLVVWTELVDGKRQDGRFTEGLQKVFNLLENSTDTALVNKYGLWLVERDRDLGIKLLTNPAQGVQIDIEESLKSLREIDRQAADIFLEHAVFTRRSVPKHLHDDLLNGYLDKMSTLLESTSLRQDLRKSRQDYATNVNTSEVTIVSYTLERYRTSESMSIRGKLILLLHGSPYIDLGVAQKRLTALPDLLFENALVSGRLGLHAEVLFTLANDLLDLASAEAYCTHAGNGDILTARNVREIIQAISLSPHPSALFRKDGRRKHAMQQIALTPAEKEDKRLELLNTLIKIQLERVSDSEESAIRDQQRTAHVIETQAIRISAKEILPSIPNDWPLPLMEGFLIRNMRRTLHERYERKLVKALLQTQTLDTSLRYWDMTEKLGGVVAEEADDDFDEDSGDLLDEKAQMSGIDSDAEGVVVVSQRRPLMEDEKTVELL